MRNFAQLLADGSERAMQEYLTKHPEHLLGAFGHGFLTATVDCVIPKYRFGHEFVSDFVLLRTVSSSGYEIDLVELESPTAQPFTRLGRFAAKLNEGWQQVHDWLAWVRENQEFFLRSLLKEAYRLHPEFDPYGRMHTSFIEKPFALICAKIIIGRRRAFSTKDNARRREIQKQTRKGIEITHYDRILLAIVRIASLRGQPVAGQVALEALGQNYAEAAPVLAYNQKLRDRRALEMLAKDSDSEIRALVAKNPHLPKGVYARLLADQDRRVRLAAKYDSSKARERDLIEASSNPNEWRRARVARNASLRDLKVLKRLAQDRSPIVRNAARRNPNWIGSS